MPRPPETPPNPIWPGIAWGHWATCSCTWGYRPEPEIKFPNAGCVVHGAALRSPGPRLAVVPRG